MNIFDSYIDAGQELNERDKEKYYTALIEFVAYGHEPKLKGAALAIFTAIRPSLEVSKQRAESGRSGGNSRSKREANSDFACKQTSSKTEANSDFACKQNASKPPSKREANGQAKSKSNSNSNSTNSTNVELGIKRKHPTVEEVKAYAKELGHPEFDAQHFCDYYESNGWKVGRNPMKDWQATVRNWIRKDAPKGGEYDDSYD